MTLSTTDFVRRVLIVVGIATLVAVIYHTLQAVFGVVLILFAGVLLAVLIDGVARWLSRISPLSRTMSVAVVLACMIVLIAAAGWFLGPRIAEQGIALTERMPESMAKAKDWLRQFGWGSYIAERLPDSLSAVLPDGVPMQAASTVFSSVFGVLPNVFIILFVGIYLAIDPHLYINALVKLVPGNHRPRAREVLAAVGTGLGYWLAGRISSMAIVGVLTAVALMVFGIPLALTLGLIAAIFSFVPYIGPIVAIVPALAVALGEGSQALLTVLAIYAGVQFAESYVITPLIQKQAISMPPALLISSQAILGVLAGIVGVAVATPIVVVIVIFVQTLYVNDVLGEDVTVIGSDNDSAS